MLNITNLSKSYNKGKTKALDNVSLELSNGIYALLGPNGAGKSTLMNILTLGLQQDSGDVSWNGIDINKAGRSYREILGYMPQQQGLYDGFTGIDFLCYIASLKDIEKSRIKSEAQRVAGLVNLADRARDRLSAYSGGMKQRILLAGAILGDPKLLILDEPTAGLDPKERIRVREIVKSMAGDKIIIFATHVVSDIETIADEVIMLKKGVIAEPGARAGKHACGVKDLCEAYGVDNLESVYMKVFGET
jgi:ABC-type multidrug transport system ATPase subunit